MESAEFMDNLLWSDTNSEERFELMELIVEKANDLDIGAKSAFDYVLQGKLTFEVIVEKELPLIIDEYQQTLLKTEKQR